MVTNCFRKTRGSTISGPETTIRPGPQTQEAADRIRFRPAVVVVEIVLVMIQFWSPLYRTPPRCKISEEEGGLTEWGFWIAPITTALTTGIGIMPGGGPV